ncbi:MAG: MerR family transcriptional regulator [Bdellovibrionota bacterium]
MGAETILPDKFFYKIGEVAQLTSLEPYVLRYWETEFNIKLTKTKNSQRLYQKKDVIRIIEIKKLLYDEKFTIAGAKKRLRELVKEKNEGTKNQMNLLGSVKSFASDRETMKKIHKEAKEALDILRADSATFDKK